MDLGLEGRRALVGGGGSGIGGGIATALAGEGARVALHRAHDGAARRTRRAALGGIGVVADLATPDGPADAVAQAVAALGGLDLLVVNTGGPPGGTFDTLRRGHGTTAIDGHAPVGAPAAARGAAAPRAGTGPVDPGRAVVVGPRADPRAHDVQRAAAGSRRPGEDAPAEIAPVRINGIAPGRIDTDRIA